MDLKQEINFPGKTNTLNFLIFKGKELMKQMSMPVQKVPLQKTRKEIHIGMGSVNSHMSMDQQKRQTTPLVFCKEKAISSNQMLIGNGKWEEYGIKIYFKKVHILEAMMSVRKLISKSAISLDVEWRKFEMIKGTRLELSNKWRELLTFNFMEKDKFTHWLRYFQSLENGTKDNS